MHRPPLPRRRYSWFLSEVQSTPSKKNSKDSFRNRTNDLTAFSVVPQPTALPRARIWWLLCYIADRYFFLYIYHKSLIQSKVTFFLIRPRGPIYVRFMYCVIKCVKTKRVLKGNFASSVFHSCNAKTQKTQICVTGPQCVYYWIFRTKFFSVSHVAFEQMHIWRPHCTSTFLRIPLLGEPLRNFLCGSWHCPAWRNLTYSSISNYLRNCVRINRK
jgi:hypothetical protein